MRIKLVVFAIAAMTASVAQAGSQSSNTSSNSSSNNGAVRERIVETYCDDGYCERYVRRRVFRDDWHRGDAGEWPRHRDGSHGDDD